MLVLSPDEAKNVYDRMQDHPELAERIARQLREFDLLEHIDERPKSVLLECAGGIMQISAISFPHESGVDVAADRFWKHARP